MFRRQRVRVWRHSVYIGYAHKMRKQSIAIMDSATTSERAKSCAREIHRQSLWLAQALYDE